jgi:Kef-type K+ transport system membrane component KefB/predicted transcriptional regulator
MNTLLVIGIIILLGTIGGRLFQKFNLPRVTGYIIIGVLFGKSFHGFLSGPVLDSFAPLISLSLGIIGFMIGAELNLEKFKRYSRSIYTILFVEVFLTFFLVGAGVTFLTGKVYMGLILGALAAATAPAATYNVLKEYKARGPVTTTTLSIVALDDGLALIIYGFASAFARSLISQENIFFIGTMARPIFEIASSVALGAIGGYVLHKIVLGSRDKERILPYTLGIIILVVGASIFFKIDSILASMVLGAVAANLQSKSSGDKEMFDLIKKFSVPIFVLFFVLVGARLDARILMKAGVLILALVYIISRSIGKVAGAHIGGKLSGAKETVTKYMGFCLFDQAGVAVGLAIAVYSTFSRMGPEANAAGILILNIITATTFLLQLVAPPMIKLGIKKADEMFRDVTEEDIIDTHKVDDVMDIDFLVIKENNNIHQIIEVMKKSDSYNFPIVDMNEKFMGITTLGEIRDTFYEEQMDQLILAGDIVREIDTIVYLGQDLKEAVDIFRAKKVNYIPVLENKETRKLVGQLEYRRLMDFITKEVLLRQQELET